MTTVINKEVPMFYKSDSGDFKQVLEGIKLKTLVYSEKTLLA